MMFCISVDLLGAQKQEIVVKCSGNSFIPDIFNGQDTWCDGELLEG